MAQDNLIRFDSKVKFLLAVLGIAFIVLTAFKVHYSSIPIWDELVPQAGSKKAVIAGTPKTIRIDEYLASTPFIMSQVHNGFPVRNESLGAGKTPLFMRLPVLHFSSLFRPQNWFYFIFDKETAFSANWNFWLFGSFVSFFFLLMLLTKNNFGLSVFGSLWLLFSSYVQWWFSAGLPDMIISLSVMAVSFIYVVFSENRITIFLNSVLFVIFALDFALFFYPPWQIVSVYLTLFLLTGYFLDNHDPEHMKCNYGYKIFFGFMAAAIIFGALFYFYSDTKATIGLIGQTVYPGKRSALGGGVGVSALFSGFFSHFWNESSFPSQRFLNICEASSFILFFPVIALILAGRRLFLKVKADWLTLLLLSYLLVLTVFMLFGFPAKIAKLTLLNMVPSIRAVFALGISNIILTVIFLSKDRGLKLNSAYSKIKLLISIAVLTMSAGLLLNSGLGYSVSKKCLFSILVFIPIFYSLIAGKRPVFIFLVLAITILPGMQVNPVSKGLAPILDKEFLKASAAIARDDPEAKWAAFGNVYDADFLKASGINVFNGTKYAPDIEAMKILDPGMENKDIYNRFVHISLHPNVHGKIDFKLRDHTFCEISIDPCSKEFRQLGIKYVVFTEDAVRGISNKTGSCLMPMTAKPVNGRWIYKISGSDR